MNDDAQGPQLNQVNVIVGNWDASLAFYRLLGCEVSDGGEWPVNSGALHANVRTPNGVSLEFDNPTMVRQYAADAARVRGPIVGFSLPSAAAVDETFERLTAAGHIARQAPYDAFWGVRYAIVEDPDGTAVGLMGPRDRSRQYLPKTRAE
jgi:catechol 2,3-dioxygenase-like lactoylglutathione lyase family enzyme